MYGGKNTLIRASVDRREACSPDVILSKIEKLVFRQSAPPLPLSEGRLFLPMAEKEIMPKSEQPKRIILTENG